MYASRFELISASQNDDVPILTMSLTLGFSGLLIDGDDVSDYARVVKVRMRNDLALDQFGRNLDDMAVILATLWCPKEALSVDPTGVGADGRLVERYFLGSHELLTPPDALTSTESGYLIEVFVGELVIRSATVGSMI